MFHENLKLGYASQIKIVMSIESVDSQEDIKTCMFLKRWHYVVRGCNKLAPQSFDRKTRNLGGHLHDGP